MSLIFIAPQLKAVSTKVGLPKFANFWGVLRVIWLHWIPLSFSTSSFSFSGLTRAITNFFFPAKPEFATIFSKEATLEIAPVVQSAQKKECKFDETKSRKARPGPGFSIARFFAASPENARKVAFLADALHNLEAGPEKDKTTTNNNSNAFVETRRANWRVLRCGLTVEKMVAKWARETPSHWRSISAPATMPVKATRPEWQTQTKKSRGSRVKIGSGPAARPETEIRCQYLELVMALDMDPKFASRQNPFKALEVIGDDEFQTPSCRKSQAKIVEIDLPIPTESIPATSTKLTTPIEEPLPVPTSTPLTGVTRILESVPLATSPLTIISPPLTPTIAPVLMHSTRNSEQYSPKKSRRQRHRNTPTSPPPVKKPLISMPCKDTPESWRQTSSPPRSPSPLHLPPKITENVWQQVQKRGRRNSGKRNMDLIPNLALALTPNLAPELANSRPHSEEADTLVRLNSPNVVILYKNKSKTTPL